MTRYQRLHLGAVALSIALCVLLAPMMFSMLFTACGLAP